MGHGPVLGSINKVQSATTPDIDPKEFAGFSYLLGDPGARDRSQWGNNLVASHGLFSRLVRALPGSTFGLWSSPLGNGVERNENPFLPSGYTYLLQFIAHDMMLTSMPFWAAADLGVDSENCRASGLVLDALYGGGPIACPAAFQTTPSMDENRYLLRLGRVAPAQGACPFRDLARVNVENGFASGGGDSINFDQAYQVNIADPRNDDGIILTQLTVLFALAHNIIAQNVQAVAKPEARFAYARAAMLLIYHAIIRGDLLPRLLHPYVWNLIKERPADSTDWLWQRQGLPLEFSHGAFRVGHAMVRPGYTINATLPGQRPLSEIIGHNQPENGAAGSWRTPLETKPNWILQWSYFFKLTARDPNYSLRIGPSRTSLDLPGLFAFPERPGPNDSFTSLRDFLSAAAARTWTIDAMITNLSRRSPSLIPAGWLFSFPDKRQAAIADWFRRNGNSGRLPNASLTPAEVVQLSADPPLPLFILLEAGLDPGVEGRSMGVLGSIIVGEVLCKRLAEESARLRALKSACQGALPARLWSSIIGIDAMPKLVSFVAEFAGLSGGATPPFI